MIIGGFGHYFDELFLKKSEICDYKIIFHVHCNKVSRCSCTSVVDLNPNAFKFSLSPKSGHCMYHLSLCKTVRGKISIIPHNMSFSDIK